MRIGMLITAIALSVVLLIISLQNVAFTSIFLIFTWQINSTLMMPLMLTSLIGVASGVCYALAFNSIIETKREEDAEEAGGKF